MYYIARAWVPISIILVSKCMQHSEFDVSMPGHYVIFRSLAKPRDLRVLVPDCRYCLSAAYARQIKKLRARQSVLYAI